MINRLAHLPMPSDAPRRARRGAFTLIELLVVISIIALLIGILLPALSAARSAARASACLANVRSIGQSAHVFAAEHKDSIPLSSTDSHWTGGGNPLPVELRGRVDFYSGSNNRIKDWASASASYMGGGAVNAFDQADPGVTKAFRCPSDPYEEGHYLGNNISSGNGLSVYKPISYGVNADVTSWDNQPGVAGADWGYGQFISPTDTAGNAKDPVPGTLIAMRSPSSTMFFADGGTRESSGGGIVNRGDVLMYTSSAYMSPGEPGTLEAILEAGMAGARWARVKLPIRDNVEAADRHGNSMNVAFADGHGAAVSPAGFEDVNLSPHRN